MFSNETITQRVALSPLAVNNRKVSDGAENTVKPVRVQPNAASPLAPKSTNTSVKVLKTKTSVSQTPTHSRKIISVSRLSSTVRDPGNENRDPSMPAKENLGSKKNLAPSAPCTPLRATKRLESEWKDDLVDKVSGTPPVDPPYTLVPPKTPPLSIRHSQKPLNPSSPEFKLSHEIKPSPEFKPFHESKLSPVLTPNPSPLLVPTIPSCPPSPLCANQAENPTDVPLPQPRIVYSREFLLSLRDKFKSLPSGLSKEDLDKPINAFFDAQCSPPALTPARPVSLLSRSLPPCTPVSLFTPGFSNASLFTPVALPTPNHIPFSPIPMSPISPVHPSVASLVPLPSPAQVTPCSPDALLLLASLATQEKEPSPLLADKISGPPDDVLLRKALSRAKEVETNPARLAARQKQIEYGIVTVGYQNYSKLVPPARSQRGDPVVPNKFQKCSKRSWDGQVRKWRRTLHYFDNVQTIEDLQLARAAVQKAAAEKKEEHATSKTNKANTDGEEDPDESEDDGIEDEDDSTVNAL